MIDVIEFGRYYRRGWKTVGGVFLFCIVCGAVYYFVAIPLYRGQVTIQFHASQQNEGLGSTLGIGLALAGLQGDKSMPERAEAFGVLKSRAFLLPFIEKMNLGPSLFPGYFNASSRSWKNGKVPKPEELHRSFVNSTMGIDDNSTTGLITVSIFLPSAESAATIANSLVHDLNETLRLSAVARATENISYLEKQLAGNPVAEIRVSIAQLIQTEMKHLVLANGRGTRTFQIIDPAVVPDRVYSPRALLVAALALLSAFLISTFLLLIRFMARQRAP